MDCGVVYASQEVGTFNHHPRLRIVTTIYPWYDWRSEDWLPGAPCTVAAKVEPGYLGCMLVIVEQSSQRILSVAAGITCGQAAGVVADQVVHSVPMVKRLRKEAIIV
jgi:hypothetical protein